MQSAAVFVALLAAASAHTIFRAPAHDSAVIKSDQQGGNFAYSVAETPAWGVVSPVVSHVAQPVATTYTVQQPATTWTAPAHTSTIVAGSTPVVSEVKTTVPVITGNVATTYGANWPYASAYTYGNTVVDNSSPIIYSAKTNLVGVETEKQINQVHHTAATVPAAVTYTAVQQPSTATVVSASGTPVTWTSNVHKQLVSSPVSTWSTVQQPANSIVSSGTQWGSSVISTPVAATTYSVPSTSVISTGTPVTTFNTVPQTSVISTGTPVTTYNTVAGVNQWNNQMGYGYGQPWAGAYQQIVV